MLRTLLLFGYVAAGDAVLLLLGVPMQRYALYVALHDSQNKTLILLLLGANVALLGVLVTSALAGAAGVRGLITPFLRKRGN